MVTIHWRTGVNMREFAYYDRADCFQASARPPTRDAQMAALQKLGVPLVRIFAVNRHLSFDDNITQVGLALDMLKANHMQAIVCLADSIWDAGYTVPGDDAFHQGQPLGHLTKSYWLDQGYSQNYLPYVRKLVTRYADHSSILAWELGNEYAIHPQPSIDDDFNAFFQFVQTVSGEIRQLSPNKLISTGLINTNQVVPATDTDTRRANSKRLYSLPTIDLISIHVYSDESEDWLAMIDADVAIHEVKKPFYVGELGADVTKLADRSAFFREQMMTWKTRGAFTVMTWAFDDSPFDTGVADVFGFARRHGDYDGLAQIMTQFKGETEPFVMAGTDLPIPEEANMDMDHNAAGGPAIAQAAPPLTLSYPITWQYRMLAHFNDDFNYSALPNKLQKREGIEFGPIATDQPLEVKAAQRGRVTLIRNYPPGYGNYICITHDWYGETYVTWYCQLASSSVTIGQNVNQGDVIGIAGQSGSATEVCLFFTLQHIGKGLPGYVVDDIVDPTPYLTDAAPARDEAVFLSNAAIDSGTIMLSGQQFKKLWQIRNTGTTSWGDGYQLVYFSDEAMGTVNSVPLPVTLPGNITVVGVDMIAPVAPGIYRSTWSPQAPDGSLFLQKLTAVIEVRASAQDTARPELKLGGETIRDGTIMEPGTTFDKTWTVRNTGNKVWDASYQLVWVTGDKMNGPDSVPLPPLRPGQQGDVTVRLTAPTTTGTARSTWMAKDQQGKLFQYEIYAEINVQEAGAFNTVRHFDSPVGPHYERGPGYGAEIWYGDHKHKGLDYDVKIGTPVVAGGKGEVYKVLPCDPCHNKSFTELGMTDQQQADALTGATGMPYNYGLGNLVVVRYAFSDLPESARQAMTAAGYADGYALVYYAHLNEFRVTDGQPVQNGTPLGLSGESGNTDGAHLHVEIHCSHSADLQLFIPPYYRINPANMFVF